MHLHGLPWYHGFILRCMGAPVCFSVIFAKGNNFHDFLLAPLKYEALPRGLLLKERICSDGR